MERSSPDFIQFAYRTEVGMVRTANEDAIGHFPVDGGYLFLVCDGMGGQKGGALASSTAIEAMRTGASGFRITNPYTFLHELILFADKAVKAKAKENPSLSGMGTTCVIVLLWDEHLYLAHVGDSRAYMFSGQALTRLTVDHSYVEQLMRRNEITEDEARSHPKRNEILQALGATETLQPEVAVRPIRAGAGNVLLICTDGVHGMVEDDEIRAILDKNASLDAKAQELADHVNAKGATDNHSFFLVGFNRASKVSSAYALDFSSDEVTPDVNILTRTSDTAIGIRQSHRNRWKTIALIAGGVVLAIMLLILFPGLRGVMGGDRELPQKAQPNTIHQAAPTPNLPDPSEAFQPDSATSDSSQIP